MRDGAKENEGEIEKAQTNKKKNSLPEWMDEQMDGQSTNRNYCLHQNLFELMDVYIVYIMTCKQISRVVLLCISPLSQSTAFMTA